MSVFHRTFLPISLSVALLSVALPGLALAEGETASTPEQLPAAISGPSAPESGVIADKTAGEATGESALPQEDEVAKPSGPMTPTDKIVRRFMELDLDTSEGVSFEEYMTMVNQRAEDRFKSMDSNQDEEVSEDEYRTFWQTRKAQWYRLKR